ncbi:MAG: FAD-dependent oxidoreductase [bacterium]|nr:FAD-dependent oxidoreductase [bacterium]
MPASDWEVEEAIEEGVKIEFLVAPLKVITKNGKISQLECLRMQLGKPDASGRRRPVPIEGSNFTIDLDAVISAIGQKPDLSFLKDEQKTAWGTIDTDKLTLATNKEGIFAAGDAVLGPASAIEAVAQGHEAAITIHRYLNNEDLREGRVVNNESLERREISISTKKISREKQSMLSPEERIKSFNEVVSGFTEEQAITEANRCLSCGICCECMECKRACEAGAVNHDLKDEILDLNVGSVILTSGFKEYDPSDKYNYGYQYQNVVTSIEFERILAASGPFKGHIQRISDGKDPKKIAFIQCIGSREDKKKYCSSVCCMYATKEAIIAKDHCSYDLQTDIFYMDLRAYGKGFESYYNRAKDEFGVKYIRSRPFSITEDEETKNLIIKYTDEDGKVKLEEYDMVVLSIALNPPERYSEFQDKLGINLDKYGFCETGLSTPVNTNREGIFVCGAFEGPKDIPETVVQASAAASNASAIISSVRGSLISKHEYPPEKDVSGEEPCLGVFICHCGINIGSVVNIPQVVEYVNKIPGVVYVEENLYTCSQDTQQNIVKKIKEHNINRVIVASCTPRTHMPLFQETCKEAGLNKYLFEMANIRDHCSWVHSKEPERATEKAKVLIHMSVAKAKTLEPLEELTTDINPVGMVIGGGLTGMTSAIKMADQGYKVYLIEKEECLGGNLNKIIKTIEGLDISLLKEELIDQVTNNEKIEVYTKANIKDIQGYIGNFKTILDIEGKSKGIEHGTVIIANGGSEYKPKEYCYGQDERIVTQLELEEKLAHNPSAITQSKNIVMIQCVGSRDQERPYCSRVCCSHALKNAIDLKKKNKDVNIYILYKDIRTYGFKENYYRMARELGVVFIRYSDEQKPEINIKNNNLEVEVFDSIIRKKLLINPDMIVLSAAILPNQENEEIGKLLKVPLTPDGFFLEAHIKLRPIDFATDGVFFAGLSHAPKTVDESMQQAAGAVSRCSTILSKPKAVASGAVSMVLDKSLCRGCEKCADGCEFKAINMVDYTDGFKVSEINPILCKGCGACASFCQAGAITPKHFMTSQINAMVEAALA